MKLAVLTPNAAERERSDADAFAAALAAAAGSPVPVIEGSLAAAPDDGFVLAFGVGAIALAQHPALCPRLVLVETDGATVEANVERFGVAAAIDRQRYSNWRTARDRESAYGLIARREIVATLQARGGGFYATTHYDTIEKDGLSDLPALVVAYLAAYDREPPEPTVRAPTAGTRTVGGGQIVIGPAITADSASGLYRGHLAGHPDDARLVTVSPRHKEDRASLRARFALPIAGVTPLALIGDIDPAGDAWRGDCLVEVEPAGRPARELGVLGEADALRIGIGVAAIAARAHAEGLVLDGIRPELIYVGVDGEVTALAPRAVSFIESAAGGAVGVPAFALLYQRETLTGRPTEAASDVFALCATLVELITGQHAFGGLAGQIPRLAAGTFIEWTGSPELGAVLRRGLARDPRDRPSASELGAALAALPR